MANFWLFPQRGACSTCIGGYYTPIRVEMCTQPSV